MASNEETELQPLNQKKEGIAGTMQGMKSFFYNPSTGQCMGRTPISWAKITVFYVIYYICLSSMFAVFLTVFFQTMDDKQPTYSDKDSLLKGNPGMGYRPRPIVKSTLIKFTGGKNETYVDYVKDLRTFLDTNYLGVGTDITDGLVDCSQMNEADPEKGCSFDVKKHLKECSGFTDGTENDFGYESGKPCILLKLNKVYGWSADVNGTSPSNVQIKCRGENDGDGDNMGKLDFLPAQGFMKGYYPYMNQPNYQAPLVMLQLNNAAKGVLIQIWCEAVADNVEAHRTDRTGGVHFEVMID